MASACSTRPIRRRRNQPGKSTLASFLERYADRIEARREEIVEMAHAETSYPKETRLDGVELPRTTDQIRQAAAAGRDAS
jgi:NADP-dependent aldehyde dehydrogenase